MFAMWPTNQSQAVRIKIVWKSYIAQKLLNKCQTWTIRKQAEKNYNVKKVTFTARGNMFSNENAKTTMKGQRNECDSPPWNRLIWYIICSQLPSFWRVMKRNKLVNFATTGKCDEIRARGTPRDKYLDVATWYLWIRTHTRVEILDIV